MILSDKWIRRMSTEHAMIEPFEGKQVRAGTISYGLSSFGYDIRVGDEYKVFTDVYGVVVDPKNFDVRSFVDIKADHCIIPPHSFALASTVEYFRIPKDVLVVCVGKSTYARCGIIVNVTPFEPERRSEERRVGNGWSSRGSRDDCSKDVGLVLQLLRCFDALRLVC